MQPAYSSGNVSVSDRETIPTSIIGALIIRKELDGAGKHSYGDFLPTLIFLLP